MIRPLGRGRLTSTDRGQNAAPTAQETALNWIDRQPLALFVIAALTLGLAPFLPEPHLVEKLRMLAAGELSRPIDIFDLIMHGAPWALLILKLYRQSQRGRSTS